MPPFAKYSDLHRYHFSLRSTTRQILLTNKLLSPLFRLSRRLREPYVLTLLETLKRGVTAILKFEISSNIPSGGEKHHPPKRNLGNIYNYTSGNDKFQTSNQRRNRKFNQLFEQIILLIEIRNLKKRL